MINVQCYAELSASSFHGNLVSQNIYATTRKECEKKLTVLIAEIEDEI
jgi:hypothetical protein